MRTLLAALVLLSGCSGEDPPPPPPPNIGNAVVTWEIQDLDGNALTCGDIGVSSALVRLGPSSVDVLCGDAQEVRFDMLLAGTYGVTIQLQVAGLGSLATVTDNLEVEANTDSTINVVLTVDPGGANRSELLLQWIVVDQDPQLSCPMVGAETVSFETTDASIGQFSLTADCEDGQALVSDLEPGGYELIAFLQDGRDERVGVAQRLNPRLAPGERNLLELNFIVASTAAPARFEGSWTLTGSVAADACEDAGADEVEIRIETRPPVGAGVTLGTATAACDLGMLAIEDLPSGPVAVRATFVLRNEFLNVTLDAQSAPSFFLREAETATASIDFIVPD